MPTSPARKAQIEQLLEEAQELKTALQEQNLATLTATEAFKLKLEIKRVDEQIKALEDELNGLSGVTEPDDEDSQFRAYFLALEKRFAIYDDPSKMIALRMQPGTLTPLPPTPDNKPAWIRRSIELSRECIQPHYSAQPPKPDKSQPEIEEVAEYLWEKKRVVLLGEPGAGKSTTLRLLARAIWEEFLPGSSTPPTLPLYAALNQWQKGSSLMEFLQNQISGMASLVEEEGDKAKLAGLARRLPELVKAGRVVVLLDGLNELPGLKRDDLSGRIDDERARMIERVAHEPVWEQTLCLLSCRIKDFAGDPVRWHDLHLQPLNRAQVEALALAHYQDRDLTNQLITGLYGEPKKRRYVRLRGKWVTSEVKLQELCQQPFYLVRLLRYYQKQGQLANNPAQLIRASVEAAMAREVTERKTITQSEAEELQTRLGYLAFNLTDAFKVGGVDKATAAAWLFHIRDRENLEYDEDTDTYINKNPREPEASLSEKKQAEKLFKQAEDANLVSDSWESIQFYHQLIQEYFAAAYLQSQPLNPILLERTTYNQFDEVWRLWAGLSQTLVAEVAAFLKDEASDVRWRVVKALSQMDDNQAVLPLITALKDEAFLVRESAASALGSIGEPAVLPLIETLQDEDKYARYWAAGALGQIGDSRAVKPLIAALEDEDSLVRYSATEALGQIGGSEALLELERLALEDEGETFLGQLVKVAAALALKRLKKKQAEQAGVVEIGRAGQ